MGGAPGWWTGLLDGHDALPAQDQAHPFHDPRAAVDGPLGRRLGTAGEVPKGIGDRGSAPAMTAKSGSVPLRKEATTTDLVCGNAKP